MAQLWVKSSPDAQTQGPFTAIELRNLAAAGHIPAGALISLDQHTWRSAAQVKGLYPSAPSPAAPGSTATASDATPFSSAATDTIYAPDSTTDYQPDATTEPQRDGAPSPTPAESIEYATPHTEQSLWELHPRGTFAFTFIAFLMLIANGAVAYLAWFAQQHHELSEHVLLLASMGGAAAFLLFAAIALILWLVWVYGIHKDLRVLSGGRHTISPGQAVGFSFLPLFDAFWAVYMPVRACGALNQHLAARGLRKASKGTVITCQLFSILFALAIPGLTPILYALSMRTIQKGMNRLIASQST